MSNIVSNEKQPIIIPKLTVRVLDGEPFEIGGFDNFGVIEEINFYSRLNSFALKADVTVNDTDNQILDRVYEPNGVKVTLYLYEVPPDIGDIQELINSPFQEKLKVLQRSFTVDTIDVLKFDTNYPYKSRIRMKLSDVYDSLILSKLITYSNFHMNWASDEMTVQSTIHRILRLYERYAGATIIPDGLFGVDENNLKRRFRTDQSTTIRDVFMKYLEALYDTRWYEFLSNTQPKPEMPTCMLAFTNLYSIDDSGMLRQKPYLTSLNMLDEDPDQHIYSLPYSDGKISKYAMREFMLPIEDTIIDLKGGPSGELKNQILAFMYRQHTFDPKRAYFEDNLKKLSEVYQLNPKIDIDIESFQKPRYFGIGPDPKFNQYNNFDESILSKYPFNIKENKYYFSNGENSLYKDVYEILFRPLIYVTLPYCGWHSPGQEVDLKMVIKSYENDENKKEPEKEMLLSMNKLVGGRWKIMNSVTNLKQTNTEAGMTGLKPMETIGLNRPRYLNEVIVKDTEQIYEPVES